MDASFGLFVVVGFLAQLVDGAMGMAYGVISTTFLLSIGIPPVFASAGVHTAEVFTTLISGIAHWRFGNVSWALVKRLVIPGVFGGVIGAYVLSSVATEIIKPYIATYLLIMGLVIAVRAFRKIEIRNVSRGLIPLGAIGGVLDAIGGGGWGPVVTSTLVARGNHPRLTIGSVNLAEFFVTIAESATFVGLVGLGYWRIAGGLVVGGTVAAPLAAYICKKLPARALMVIVGVTIVVLQVRSLWLG